MAVDRKELSKWLKTNPEWDRKRLCKSLGVSFRTLYNWTSGSSPIPQKHQGALQFLLDGKELPSSMATDTISLLIDDERYRKYALAAKEGGMDIKEWIFSVIDEQAEVAAENPYSIFSKGGGEEVSFPRISLVGNVAAGAPAEGDGVVEELEVFKSYPKGCFALRVCGESMDPPIPNGAIVVVKPWTDPDPPKLGTVVVYDDERGVALKELALSGGQLVLRSRNPTFPDFTPLDGGKISAVFVEVLEGR